MDNVINEEWLTIYMTRQNVAQERRHELAQEITEYFRDQLEELNLTINLEDQPKAEVTVDPFTPFSHHRLIENVVDIQQFVRPFLNQSKIITMALSQPSNAIVSTVGQMSAPATYASQAQADKHTGKMTGIAHADNWNIENNVFSSAALEFDIPALDKDYDQLHILINYLFDHRMESTVNPNETRQFSYQEVQLALSVKEFSSPGNEKSRVGFPNRTPLYNYKHRYLSPNIPNNIKSVEKPKMYLKRVALPKVKKNYSYKVIIELYVYSWIVNGRAANEANFTIIPAS